jgi:hypothetical protein
MRRLLRAAYGRRDEPLGRALKGLARGGQAGSGFSLPDLLIRAGVSPRLPGALLTADDWYQVGRQLAGGLQAGHRPRGPGRRSRW